MCCGSLLDVLVQELPVEIRADGVVDEPLALALLVPCLIAEHDVVIPAALHTRRRLGAGGQQWVSRQCRRLPGLGLQLLLFRSLVVSVGSVHGTKAGGGKHNTLRAHLARTLFLAFLLNLLQLPHELRLLLVIVVIAVAVAVAAIVG